MIKRKSYKKHLKNEIEFNKFRKKLHKVLEHNIIAIDNKNIIDVNGHVVLKSLTTDYEI